jgi:hypothetical protein
MGKMGELAAGLQRHRNVDPLTSHKSAKAIKKTVSRTMLKVWHAIKSAGDTGMTDDEIQHHMVHVLGQKVLAEGGYRKRRSDLTALGFVVWNGHTRKSASGKDANVWIIDANKGEP